ncbi:hypothetical protein JK628_23120 (plasmid) [Shewanella sp. KX20019]|uniref:hypothetical protein n=1 Tax=Shewanella sp. KX20019 TaxID=2803864 RepID=UPI001927C112|nr:hypothetical protein [Shewanella sp. KX20019]QQX82706.1 hypothetical protein JK628_23120 [Shewanella sp. KX20019]
MKTSPMMKAVFMANPIKKANNKPIITPTQKDNKIRITGYTVMNDIEAGASVSFDPDAKQWEEVNPEDLAANIADYGICFDTAKAGEPVTVLIENWPY